MFAPYYYALNWIDVVFPAWREIGATWEDIENDDEIAALVWYFLEIMA